MFVLTGKIKHRSMNLTYYITSLLSYFLDRFSKANKALISETIINSHKETKLLKARRNGSKVVLQFINPVVLLMRKVCRRFANAALCRPGEKFLSLQEQGCREQSSWVGYSTSQREKPTEVALRLPSGLTKRLYPGIVQLSSFCLGIHITKLAAHCAFRKPTFCCVFLERLVVWFVSELKSFFSVSHNVKSRKVKGKCHIRSFVRIAEYNAAGLTKTPA